MFDRFLTESPNRRDDRRTAILMLVLSQVVVATSAAARADEPAAAPPLMERALAARGLDPPPVARAVAARWLPTLTLAAAVEQSAGAGVGDQITVLGSLSWPFDDGRPSGIGLEHERLRRTSASRRQRLVERIAEAWQRRLQAETLADDVEATLSADEADAELDVLTGRLDEDGP
jgi:hypothetical protein